MTNNQLANLGFEQVKSEAKQAGIIQGIETRGSKMGRGTRRE